MDEAKRQTAKNVLEGYLTTLDAVTIYSARKRSIKTSELITGRLEKLKEDSEGRKLVAEYYGYEISDKEVDAIFNEKIGYDGLTDILTKVATALKIG